MSMYSKSSVFIFFVLLPITSFAHVLTEGSHDLYHGFFHPLTGYDHFLTMFGIGVLSFYCTDKKQHILKLPCIFCLCLLVAFVLQTGNLIKLPELMPAYLLIALGFIILKSNKSYSKDLLWLALPIIAFTHGHIHTSDIAFINTNFAYIFSFISATFILHVFGIKFSEYFCRISNSTNKIFGGLFMLSGLFMIV